MSPSPIVVTTVYSIVQYSIRYTVYAIGIGIRYTVYTVYSIQAGMGTQDSLVKYVVCDSVLHSALFQGVQALASTKAGKVNRFKSQLVARELSMEQLPGSLQQAVEEALAKEAEKNGTVAAVAAGGEAASSDTSSSNKKKPSLSSNKDGNDKAEMSKDEKPSE